MSWRQLPEQAQLAAYQQQHESEIAPNSDAKSPIRVVIAISKELERLAWSLIVGAQPDMELIAEAASCDEVLALLEMRDSDVILIDESILDSDVHERFLDYCSKPFAGRFVMMALHDLDQSIEQRNYAFVYSHVLKGTTAEELLLAIRTSARSRRPGRVRSRL